MTFDVTLARFKSPATGAVFLTGHTVEVAVAPHSTV
jgi:hypothetical protein